MLSRPETRRATTTARTQFRVSGGCDIYATTRLEFEPDAVVVTICGPGDLHCERQRITDPDVVAYLRWHLDTVGDLTERTGA